MRHRRGSLDRRHRPAVDDVLTPVNEGGAIGNRERDQLRHSSGRPDRPIGMPPSEPISRQRAVASSLSACAANRPMSREAIAVSMKPGAMLFTREDADSAATPARGRRDRPAHRASAGAAQVEYRLTQWARRCVRRSMPCSSGRFRKVVPGSRESARASTETGPIYGAVRDTARRRPQSSSTRPSTRLTEAVRSPRSVRQVRRSIRPRRTHCIIHCAPCAFARTWP
jgi:hypothetical protein